MKSSEPLVFSFPSEQESAVTRIFHAPIEHVFRVFTEPLYAPALWAENPADVRIEEMDVRPGGRYSISVKGRDGSSTRFYGEYREVVRPRRVVNTFNVSALPGVLAVETDDFEAIGTSTRLSVRWKYDNRADRDRMGGPDLEAALTASWERVDQILTATSPETSEITSPR